ncbi:SOS-response transcriptional repressor LexA [Sphingomonas sp. BE123]|uniref:LexA family protein n=1 Tax=Sphingomonas sp. BE123 TaxID=2817842 RepID=UPI00285C00D6|nr:hypothetical protein [Sphingomonas sp. BE123]MDR6851051.1 SOS-response transcriptional repressor LexA [Sphingomonas sp. BE123]
MTALEQQVLSFIRDRIETIGLAPTIEEIMQHVGAKSKSSVARIVDGLTKQKLLIRERFRPRGLKLPELPNLDAVPTHALRAALARRGEGA